MKSLLEELVTVDIVLLNPLTYTGAAEVARALEILAGQRDRESVQLTLPTHGAHGLNCLEQTCNLLKSLAKLQIGTDYDFTASSS